MVLLLSAALAGRSSGVIPCLYGDTAAERRLK